MGTTERKQRQKEEVYDSILSAAWSLVKQDGWQGLSIRKIAEAIEYSIPVIYDHFENKEAILAQFTKTGFSKLNQNLAAAITGASNPDAGLGAVAKAYWSFAMDNKEYYQLMYGVGMPTCETVNNMRELQELTEILRTTVLAVIEKRGNDNGQTMQGDSFVKMKSFWSMLHGLVSIQMMASDSSETTADNEVLNESVHNFVAGLNS